jgi:hypothetical protein
MYSIEIHINGQPHYLTDKGIKPADECTANEADEHRYKITQFSVYTNAIAAYYATGTPHAGFVCRKGQKDFISLEKDTR